VHRALLTAFVGAAVLATSGCSVGSPAGAPADSPAPAATSRDTASVAEPSTSASPSPGMSAAGVPRFQHVVIVVEENHGTAEAMGMRYLAELRRTGAVFPQSHGVSHPSEPNYLALWSGSTHGVTSDACPIDLGAAPSLGSQLLAAGDTVAAYAQGLPSAGSTACSAGPYARKHDPLADFSATAGAAHDLPFSAFPSDYDRLPSVSFVAPDLDHDAHDGTLATADDWLRGNLGGYATWAATHDSLLIVTFDEEEGGAASNRILTVFSGAHVRPGTSSERMDHVNVLHTIESSFGLPSLGATAAPITDIWQ